MFDLEFVATWMHESALSLPALVLLAILFMYLGRNPAHRAIRAAFTGIERVFLLGRKEIQRAHARMTERNREVLLALGRDATERSIEREFHRVDHVVHRDLSGYPALHRKLSDQITAIDEDYREATDSPPVPPPWIKAAATIAEIPSEGDPIVSEMLGNLEDSFNKAQKRSMDEYRKASRVRHGLLQRMLPYWRKLDKALGRVNGTIEGIGERSRAIDGHMAKYEQIRAGSDEVVRALSASSMSYFLTSGIVLTIALLGGFVNFHLIALPMSEMVGASAYVGPLKVSSIAALVIILTEVAMGLFQMESLRITRMFPVIGSLDDVMRRRMIWVSFGLLLTLACVESSLAYMRDLLAADAEALTQQLAGVAAPEASMRWIPSVGQMVLGFILPFVLTFVAIPLESFISASRTFLGSLLCVALQGVALLFEALAALAKQLGEFAVHAYDFTIIFPLRVEELVVKSSSKNKVIGSLVKHEEIKPVLGEGGLK